LLETIRQSSLSSILLPQTAGTLRANLILGKTISLLSLAVAIALLPDSFGIVQITLAVSILPMIFYLPMIIACTNPRTILNAFLPLLRFFNLLLAPLNWPRNVVFRHFRAEARKSGKQDSEEEEAQEVEAYIDEAEEEGIFEPDEAALVRQVIEFGDTVVKEIMTPRVKMEFVEKNLTINEFHELVADLKYSRFPVYEDKIDNVLGVVHIKSSIGRKGEFDGDSGIQDIMGQPYFVPESKKVSSLLRDFQAQKQQLAIVVDEYGGTAGLITLEDVLEEIVGDIEDEHDIEENQQGDIVETPDGALIVSGNVDVSEIEKILDVDLDDVSFETISGLALNHLKYIPKPGEMFTTDTGVIVEIIEANEKTISRLKLSKREKENE
jgi:putative hemolysin